MMPDAPKVHAIAQHLKCQGEQAVGISAEVIVDYHLHSAVAAGCAGLGRELRRGKRTIAAISINVFIISVKRTISLQE